MITEIIFIDIYDHSRRLSFNVDHLSPLFMEARYDYVTLAGSHNFEEDAAHELLSRAKSKKYLFPHNLYHNGIYVAEFLV